MLYNLRKLGFVKEYVIYEDYKQAQFKPINISLIDNVKGLE